MMDIFSAKAWLGPISSASCCNGEIYGPDPLVGAYLSFGLDDGKVCSGEAAGFNPIQDGQGDTAKPDGGIAIH
jgi:hypothetical protein